MPASLSGGRHRHRYALGDAGIHHISNGLERKSWRSLPSTPALRHAGASVPAGEVRERYRMIYPICRSRSPGAGRFS